VKSSKENDRISIYGYINFKALKDVFIVCRKSWALRKEAKGNRPLPWPLIFAGSLSPVVYLTTTNKDAASTLAIG